MGAHGPHQDPTADRFWAVELGAIMPALEETIAVARVRGQAGAVTSWGRG